ncbi:S1 domain [Dillenia turbinata]|uniref:Protein RRP5 homolog n=1 Tax=Dillenia turbinata TaxID=194707 RepID=A0AAN8ZPK2_9MAGN
MAPSSEKSQRSFKKKKNDSKKFPQEKLHKPSQKPFKSKRKSNDSVPETLPIQLEDDVPDFPRGGRRVLNRREEEEIRAEVDAEFEREERETKGNKKKKLRRKPNSSEDDLGSLFGEGITGKLPKFANRITLKNVSSGMKLWGVVAEVNDKDLVISLPGGLRGLVHASEVFDPILDEEMKDAENSIQSSLFHVGQLVSCVVLQVDDDKTEKAQRKIWLSLRLSLLHKGFTLDAIQEGMILMANVKSVEDHGYILHFGLPSFTGFLPKRSQAESLENKLNTGQLLQGVVRSIDKVRKVVHLSSDDDSVSKCMTKDFKGISIDLLVPGMLVNARVRSTLENGIMLSFLTYFTGTVDLFHLQSLFPTANWKDDYYPNKKANARILFIDPSTRAVGLTLNPHLVQNKTPPSLVKTGDIFEQSKVVRVDRSLGLLLEVPSAPAPTPAYVSISEAADEEIRKLEKKFVEGSHVRVRILGFRHLEGLATGTLKAIAFEGSLFTHADVKPGMVVKAKVIAVDTFGAIVQFASGVKALCPLPHMSEFDIAKPAKKFKVGASLVFRVLGCKSKRITVTNKKTLVKSKLDIISSYADATEGLITHGWITTIERHGCFVRFYNGVQGFAPRSELGLESGIEASSMYHVGQVVKCRVTCSIPASRRINLSFIMTPSRVSESDMVKVGGLVSGVVVQINSRATVVHTNAKGYSMGTIYLEHLADHHGQAELMRRFLKPGYEFDQLLVLDIEGNNLVLSAKYSLINSAGQLPLDITQIHPQSIVHGYVCNKIDTGFFVRFLGRLTGFCPRKKATDDKNADLSEVFYVGQSVRSNILDVDKERGRIKLSLMQSSCFSTDASFIQSYFLLEEKIGKLQADAEGCKLKWVETFEIGSIAEGKVQKVEDSVDGIHLETGSIVRAVVLDVTMAERIVDLSLKPEFVGRFNEENSTSQKLKKKRKREDYKDLQVHQTVNATVEIVLSIPNCDFAIGYASIMDYNTQKLSPKHFYNGQRVNANVMALPSPSTAGRLLLLLHALGDTTETSSSKRAKKKSSYDVGSLVQAEVTEVKPLELRLKFGVGLRGRLHITEVGDGSVEDPFGNLKLGQTLTARIVAKANHSNRQSFHWELSTRPTILSGSEGEGKFIIDDFKFSTGQHVTGYVCKVDSEWIWLTVSRHVTARVFLLDSSSEPDELKEFQKRFNVGKAVSGYVLSSNKEKKTLRLVLRPLSGVHCGEGAKVDDANSSIPDDNLTSYICEGDVVGGRILRILPGISGLLVQIAPHLHGKVHFTELTDDWDPEPLAEYGEGQFVKCKVLEVSPSIKGTLHVDLSLRSSLCGVQIHDPTLLANNVHFPFKRLENVEDIHPDMIVQGYVKNVMSKGCFILLSRKLDAKILLSNLSDDFIEDPQKDFPVGKLVTGRVLSVEPLSKRVEVTLKSALGSGPSKSEINILKNLSVGDIITGKIKRIESYGLFVIIDHSNLVGLCHVSELSDDHIDNIESKHKVGDRVTAKVLKVDVERHRISLGMKTSYLVDHGDNQIPSTLLSADTKVQNAHSDSSQLRTWRDSNLLVVQDLDADVAEEEDAILAQAESRASIPPLEVSLDDIEPSDKTNLSNNTQDPGNNAGEVIENKRRAKKREKEEREQEIRAAEERLLEKDEPRTTEEFEKLVRSSPNSSKNWIEYMAFMVSLSDVEKARSIAERALRTINVREESEKLNIWVALFNLENKFGNPPERAVVKVFERALQYCDPKKVHLQLLGMYERTEQHNLAEELLNKMVKKFRQSRKIWLRQVQLHLKLHQDGVQSIVNRALLSLPRHKHIKFISQAAILEFKCGVPDRARTMFEEILREYPKRTDLWNIYLDQEIHLGDIDIIRALFERALSLSLPPKKMKFLFKKYLEYEKSHGDEERVDYVKRKAMEYAESTLDIDVCVKGGSTGNLDSEHGLEYQVFSFACLAKLQWKYDCCILSSTRTTTTLGQSLTSRSKQRLIYVPAIQ